MLFVLLMAATPPPCTTIETPFADAERRRFRSVRARVHSKFGEYRRSYVRGHKHAGIDLRGKHSEQVFAICDGVVVDVMFDSPHRTVVVRHELPDGTRFYSSYKHIEEIAVRLGQIVDAETRLGRLFTKTELRRARFGRAPTHLHLEIRKRIDDDGAASFTAMTMKELRRYCLNPLAFLRRHLK